MRRSPRSLRLAIAGLAAAGAVSFPGAAVAGTLGISGVPITSELLSNPTNLRFSVSYDSRLVNDPGTADRVSLRMVEGSSAVIRHEGAAIVPSAESHERAAVALAACRFLVVEARCSGDVVSGRVLLHNGNDVGRLEGTLGGIIYGGPGRDVLQGGAGDDVLHGDDSGTSMSLTDEPYADEFFGGGGADRVVTVGAGGPVTVTLDDVANDGIAGEGDNVHSDVEGVSAGEADENLLVGNELPNRLAGRGELIGRGGADELIGSFSRDILEGGSGEDDITASAKDDLIRADDGEHDTVDCGDGHDTVHADAVDDLTNCEVELP